MGWAMLRGVEDDLGTSLSEVFGVFGEAPFAAASIEQLHKAHLRKSRGMKVASFQLIARFRSFAASWKAATNSGLVQCRIASDRLSVVGVRRDKAALSSGCKSHPANAPAGSNRSSYGGNEVAEAFG
jgi:hypothetical protein